METLVLALLFAAAAHALKTADQRRRIALLGGYLSRYAIEKHMETLVQGYLRALDETDPERSEPIWRNLASTEATLAEQLQRLVADVASADEPSTRISTLPVYLPFATQWASSACADLRKVLAVHARGVAQVVANAEQRPRKGQAYTLSAELLLLQHTCHWFCKSKTVASARLMARHRTTHEQVLDSVSPATRQAYTALLAR